ncbi:MAG: 1-acyl-sn-glycerol-3-phosphate acyltransferase [Natronospirillum sp.]|uniref:1-acyl-sn-glycerol-3-phosphate acyltransferase n=1 Tax=Natronospirillum sp. TaxID=2812955 RepID=UPI0025F493FE|nr:1-acyl-sn-glycerol-3-phosphate acyltransferase [Natronospirillum sp.]MCH8551102.1 1-acyl-sn-glycerol-3-phosphate acyltransferase [Natronospirillum sp.]
MDALTWQLEANRLSLKLSSRDSATTGAAGKAQQHGLFGCTADGQAQLLTTHAGMTFGLLMCVVDRDRHTPETADQTTGTDLLVSLSSTSDLAQVADCLQHRDLHGQPPWSLLVFQGLRPPVLWHWNGQALRQIIAPSPPLKTPGATASMAGLAYWSQFRRNKDSLALQVNGGTATMTTHKNGQCTEHPLSLTLPQPQILQGAKAPRFEPGPIDVCGLFEEKNPGLYRSLPALVPPLLRWIAREKVMNEGLWDLRDVPSYQFSDRVLNRLGVRASLHPRSCALPQPAERPVFIANHPTGGYDGVLLLAWLLQYYPRLRVVVTDALLSVPHLRPFLVPVDRYRQARSSTLNVKEAFASDDALLIFPAGRTGRTQEGRIVDAPWQKMPVTLARQFERPLVPLHIEGHHSRVFNRVAALRQRFGIKLNLEMLLLARDFMNPPCRHFVLAAGKPVSVSELEQMGARDDERLKALRDQYELFAEQLRCQLHPPTAAITGEVPV